MKLFQGRLISSQTKLWIVEKGPMLSSVSSIIFFENLGLGEKEIFLTADNCCGQNKNNYIQIVFELALYYWPSHQNYTVILGNGAYQVFTRLVLWSLEKEI